MSGNYHTLFSVYKSRKVLLDLMRTQKYQVDEYSNFSINEVEVMLNNEQLDMILEKEEEPKRKICIRYLVNKKSINSESLNDIIMDVFEFSSDLKMTKEDTLLLIIKDEPNDSLRAALKHVWEKEGYFITVLSIKRLQFNILNHILVPPHRIISVEEEKEIMKQYNITEKTQLPDISRFDPVAQVIGIRPGQICEIMRPSKTAVKAPYYRVCV
jgi:DNA-directed RNA polymerase subunit H (RpoH/RPB5)